MEFRTQYLLLSHLKYTYKEKKISKNNPLILATNPNHPVRTSELHVNQIQINCGPKLNTIRHKLLFFFKQQNQEQKIVILDELFKPFLKSTLPVAAG